MNRTNLSSGAKWEDVVGYSRAVRIGNIIEVSGCTSVDGDQIRGHDDPYEQCRFTLSKIQEYIESLGGSLEDVIKTRIYVTDISRWEEVARAHGEFFGKIKPATAMVEVSALIDPRMIVEVEASAVVSE